MKDRPITTLIAMSTVMASQPGIGMAADNMCSSISYNISKKL